MEVSGQLHVSAALPPGKARSTHWIGIWVGSIAGLVAVGKRKISCPYRTLSYLAPNRTPAVHPVARRYTD
jgi:hypothetical protein